MAVQDKVRSLVEHFADSAHEYSEAVSPPPAIYNDPDFFEFEKAAIFDREWLCIGRADEIPNPGDYFSRTMLGEPVIVVRNQDGKVNAMSAVCPHRSACITAPTTRPFDELYDPVPDAAGHVDTFKCPYHWWVYDLDGKLVGAPEMARTPMFKQDEIRLPEIRCEVWQGFVFINFDDNAEPLAPRLAQVSEVLDQFHCSDLVSRQPDDLPGAPYNWKVMAENFIEAYHASRLHDGYHDFAPSASFVEDPYSDESAALSGRTHNTIADGAFNKDYHITMPVIEGLSDELRRVSFFAYVPPTLLIATEPDMVVAFTVQPTSATTQNLRFYYMVPKSTAELPDFDELLVGAKKGLEDISAQDLIVNSSVMLGKTSRYATRGVYCWQEQLLSQFNRWLNVRYQRGVRNGASANGSSARVTASARG